MKALIRMLVLENEFWESSTTKENHKKNFEYIGVWKQNKASRRKWTYLDIMELAELLGYI